MDKGNEECIARLTELARRQWGDEAQVYVDKKYGHASVSVPDAVGDGARVRVLAVTHPRADDALEAALLVLAQEPSPEVEERHAKLVAVADKLNGLRRWGEDFATELEQRADRLDRNHAAMGKAFALREVAAELRERARKEGEMSDDERLAQLTKLARKAYRNAGLTAAEHEIHDGHMGYEVLGDVEDGLMVFVWSHPRALDALEAALLVLAGEDRHRSTTEYAQAMTERAERAEAELLIARSSLGTPDVQAVIDQADADLTDEVMRRIAEINSKPPAWVEAIASRMESQAADFEATERDVGRLLAQQFRAYAAEMRARSTEGR